MRELPRVLEISHLYLGGIHTNVYVCKIHILTIYACYTSIKEFF